MAWLLCGGLQGDSLGPFRPFTGLGLVAFLLLPYLCLEEGKMGKHRHGKRRNLSCAEPEARSAVQALPTGLEAAKRQEDAASPSPTHVGPARLDRVLTEPLRRALASEGFSACTDLASLLPQELIELDTTLSLHTAESICKLLPRSRRLILTELRSLPLISAW